MQFLSGISVTCFVSSYIVAMALECTRPFWRIPGRTAITAGFTIAGLFAQAVYLTGIAKLDVGGEEVGLLADWYSWSLLLSWAVAVVYLILLLRKPETTIGYFLLPPVLLLVGMSLLMQDRQPFSRQQAAGIWSTVHGISMLLGATAVLIGFLAGCMYLVQSARLKRKVRASRGLKLPTLEWLQRLNRGTLIVSTILVGFGTVAGVIMNLNASGTVPWTSSEIILPFVLLVWLLAATTVEMFYKPARQGRKISYLTLATFGFLVLAMIGVLGTEHGGGSSAEDSDSSDVVHDDSVEAAP